MATTNRIPGRRHPVSQDDGGLWMKMDFNPVMEHRQRTWGKPSLKPGEKPQAGTKVVPSAPAVMLRHYGNRNDEGENDVFMPPPPPPYMAPSPPTGGSRGTTDPEVNKFSVTVTNGAVGVTEAKANPQGLGWHHGEKQLMATQNKTDEVTANDRLTNRSKEGMDSISPSEEKGSAPSMQRDQTTMESTCILPETEGHQQGSTTGQSPCTQKSNQGSEDTAKLSEQSRSTPENHPEENNLESNKYPNPKHAPANVEESAGKETDYDASQTDKDKTRTKRSSECKGESEDICHLAETDSKQKTENIDCSSVETNVAALPRASDNDFTPMQEKTCGPPELCKCDQNKTELAEGTSKGEEHGDTTCRSIATDIQQGKELLQRLRVVQERQDEQQLSDCPLPSQHIVQETSSQTARDREGERGALGIEEDDLGAGGEAQRNETEKGESTFNADKNQQEKTNKVEQETSTAKPAQPSHHRIARVEADCSEDDQSDSGVSADFSPVNSHEIHSAHRQFSSTETPMVREIHQKHNLQRARGLLDLVDDPDVLEIPFKTNVLPKLLLSKDGVGQSTDWQFSEEKMKKEISQEIRRELVLVNQGKIPGEYSKGAILQLKETKMLFEAFQQDNTEGPTRHRKPSPSLLKDHIYPSVLERTRSLEMLSQKRRPVSRAQSLRQYNCTTSEMEARSENQRAKSPSGVSRDKARSAPYPKQDKHLRLHRSMDSLNIDVPASSIDNENQMGERKQSLGAPILKDNPFFKLRPALSLKPEVEKDIQESKKREEELRRQRCTLYGETRQHAVDEESSSTTATLNVTDVRQQPKGKLDRIWPPPSKTDQMKSGQTQEPKVQRPGGQKLPLWQRWESGLINGQPSKEKD
ncbi:uncharacterized protein LOC115363460 isoform X2 [Myripristis murdjan]|uniref:uncharacterized protein LOC115363460 isoform X2 n=1 Tax=Myripristis murdjan TaxID=586833 RepID=UPI0011763ECC|nr:uncharacterized protein LOC115363460 isoform X2 [Myripristis murdjan]